MNDKKNKKTRHIVIVTTTRAEWGLLQPLANELWRRQESGESLQVSLVVGGTHHKAEHGNTISEIRKNTEVPIRLVDFLGNSSVANQCDMAVTMGKATSEFARVFNELNADVVVILGDRFEILSAAVAACASQIALVHLEGGHVTSGALDDRFRNAITKLADVHLVAMPVHQSRILAMGEPADRVHVVNSISIDNINNAPILTDDEFSKLISLELKSRPLILCTLHPETARAEDITAYASRCAEIFLAACERALDHHSEPCFVFTAANLDPGGDDINRALRGFCERHAGRSIYKSSLGHAGYVSALRRCACVLGNSSSGILEAAAIGVPVINIGDRQLGRDRYGPVTDVPFETSKIANAIQIVLDDAQDGKPRLSTARPASGVSDHGGVSGAMADIIMRLDLGSLAIKDPVNIDDERVQL